MSKKMKVTVTGVALFVVAAVIVVVIGFSSSNSGVSTARFGVPSAKAAEPIGHIGNGKAAEAVENCGSADKYAFVLFYRDVNGQLDSARAVVEGARKRISRKSELVEVNITDPTELDIVNKFGANRAMLPLVLVLAPNGAIMGGLPARLLNEDKLVSFEGSKASEQALKALQQKNMVALCVQGKKTADNTGAMRSVADLLSDPKYGPTTAVVTADPSDPAEAKFLTQLGIDPKTPIATTALLAPPGSVVFTFQGGMTKDKLLTEVQNATARKSGGCCPPGSNKSCGPTGAPATPQKTPMTAQPLPGQPKVQVKQAPTATTAPTTSAATKTAPTTSATSTATKQGK